MQRNRTFTAKQSVSSATCSRSINFARFQVCPLLALFSARSAPTACIGLLRLCRRRLAERSNHLPEIVAVMERAKIRVARCIQSACFHPAAMARRNSATDRSA